LFLFSKDSSNNTKEEILEQPSIEKPKELNVPQVIQPSPSQLSEQVCSFNKLFKLYLLLFF